MTRALENMAADGFADAISPEALTSKRPTKAAWAIGLRPEMIARLA